MRRRDDLVALALFALGACAVPGAPAASTVPPDQRSESFSELPLTPRRAEYAMLELHRYTQDDCPFLIATCADANVDRRGTSFHVENLACRQDSDDRCSFDLFERVAGRGRVRSRCTARFRLAGTFHDPPSWEVKHDDDDNARMRCQRRPWRTPVLHRDGDTD